MPLQHPYPPRSERYLADYKLQFINADLPILSFIYAVMAGKETALYCDYTGDFVTAYLLDHFPKDRSQWPPHITKFVERLAQFDEKTNGGKNYVTPTKDDWALFVDCLKEELVMATLPQPFW